MRRIPMMWLRVSLAAALLAVSADRGGAIDLASHLGSYGAHVGYAKTRDADSGDMLFGGQIELGLGPWLGVQGAVDYSGTQKFFVGTGPVRDRVEVRSIPVTLTGRLYLPMPGGISPFLAAGAGWYRQSFQFPADMEQLGFQDRTVSTFGWHLGLGLRIPTSDRVSIFGEARYIFLDPNRNLGNDVQQEMRNVDYNSTYLAGGVNFHF